MHDLSKLAAQVRGARALLGWSQSYLADGISVRRLIIADFESCKREPQEATLSALKTELSAAGIVLRTRVSSFWNGHQNLTYPPDAQR
jgi:ribosome-binding protein aMBF1 (putative translation factor)